MIALQCADCGTVTRYWRFHFHEDGSSVSSWTQPENHRAIPQDSEIPKKIVRPIELPEQLHQEETA